MADVTTTIGSRADESIDIDSVSGVGPEYEVSLNSATTSTDNGDSLVDNSSNVFLITDGAGTDTLTVRDSEDIGSEPTSGGSEVTQRYFSLIDTWEGSLDDTPLFDDGDHAIGHLMADSSHEEKNLNIGKDNGRDVGGDGILDQITLTVPATSANDGERHDGTHDTGAKIKLPSSSPTVGQAIKCTARWVPMDLSWFELDANDRGHYGIINADQNTSNAPVMHHLIVHNTSGASGNSAFLIGGGASTGLVVHNCALYNVDASGTRPESGISGRTDKVFEVYNCSVLSIIQGGSGTARGIKSITDIAAHVVQNTIAVDMSDNCFDDDLTPTNATLTNNIASDTSNDGHLNSISSESAGDLFVSIVPDDEDLRLKSGSNSAVAAGVDLSSLSYTDIEIDITGVTRSGDWDIGADQRVAEVTTALPAAMNTYQQMVR